MKPTFELRALSQFFLFSIKQQNSSFIVALQKNKESTLPRCSAKVTVFLRVFFWIAAPALEKKKIYRNF